MKRELKFRSIFMAMLVMLIGVAVAACSADKDDEPANQLIGKWIILSGADLYQGKEYFDFHADGTFTRIDIFDDGREEIDSNHRYTIVDNMLKLDFNIHDGV